MSSDNINKIWDYYFKVRVSYLGSRSSQELQYHGTTLTGVKAIDADIHNQEMTTMMPICRMIDLFKQGINIKIVSTSDIEIIYQYISDHLTFWINELERGMNIRGAPIEDLIMMDRFANEVYAHAKYHFTKKVVDSLIANKLLETTSLNSFNMFNKNNLLNDTNVQERNGVVTINSDSEVTDSRHSYENYFKDKLTYIGNI
jgi:hypothetical protein